MSNKTRIVVKLIGICFLAGIGITSAFLGLWWVAALSVAGIAVGVAKVVLLSRKT